MKIIGVAQDDQFLVDMEQGNGKGFIFNLSSPYRSRERNILSFLRFIEFDMLDSSSNTSVIDLEKIYQRPIKE